MAPYKYPKLSNWQAEVITVHSEKSLVELGTDMSCKRSHSIEAARPARYCTVGQKTVAMQGKYRQRHQEIA